MSPALFVRPRRSRPRASSENLGIGKKKHVYINASTLRARECCWGLVRLYSRAFLTSPTLLAHARRVGRNRSSSGAATTDEGVETLALPAGVTALPDFANIPEESRPPKHLLTPWPPRTPGRGKGVSYPKRVGRDGTRWCLYCNKTLDPERKTLYHARCYRERERLRKTPAPEAFTTLPTEELDVLFEHAQRLNEAATVMRGREKTYQNLRPDELRAVRQAAQDVVAVVRVLHEYRLGPSD